MTRKVFKMAHAATRTALSKARNREKGYRKVFASKLKWAWSKAKEAPKAASSFTFNVVADVIGSYKGMSTEFVIGKETAKAYLIGAYNDCGNDSFWMPKSAEGSEWGWKMFQQKANQIGITI